MPKFRKKPDDRIFNPIQFTWKMTVDELERAGGCSCRQQAWTYGHPHLHTIHAGQIVMLEDGDWIMPEPDEIHFYPIKNEVFQATYEPVED